MNVPIYPSHAIEVSAVASEAEVVAIFRHAVFTPGHAGFEQSLELSAAVSMPWQAAIGLRDMLTQLIDQRMKPNTVQ